MFQFVKGSTFQFAGSFQLDGAPYDLTGWTPSAAIHDATGEVLISNLTASWIDATQGVLQLTAPSTSNWPPGKARIDVSIQAPSGSIYRSTPDYFRILDTPLSV